MATLDSPPPYTISKLLVWEKRKKSAGAKRSMISPKVITFFISINIEFLVY